MTSREEKIEEELRQKAERIYADLLHTNEEFARHTLAPERSQHRYPSLYSYREERHIDLLALLLNPLNAPVLAMSRESKKHRVLFKDYPSLKYIIALDTNPPRVLTRGKSIPLEVLLGGGKTSSAHRMENTRTGSKPESLTALKAMQMFGALTIALGLALLALFLIR